MNDNQKTVTGLSILITNTPFKELFGTVLDQRGPWTNALSIAFDNWDDDPSDYPPYPLLVWEGTCAVTVDDEGTADEWFSYDFAGKFRPITPDEAALLSRGILPLSNRAFPAFDNRFDR